MDTYGEVTGIVTKITPEMSGQKKDGGRWAKKALLINNGEKYDPLALVQVWDRNFEKIELVQLGTRVKCRFRVATREWEGRYYTDLTLDDITILEQPKPQTVAPEVPPQYVAPPQDDTQEQKCLLDEQPKQAEDLPF